MKQAAAHMPRFGTAGNPKSFYAQGHSASLEAPAWLAAQGLFAYEYSLGHGLSLREETARAIGEGATRHGVCVSVHAPYFINLASPDPDRQAKSVDYIVGSARCAAWLGGTRVVVHVGAQQKQERETALSHCRDGLSQALEQMTREGLEKVRLCPETMGKPGQIGTLSEVLRLCRELPSLIPCLDFAHLHAISGGGLTQREDYAAVLSRTEQEIGEERAGNMHIHFSSIQFGIKGEIRHRTFAESAYGPPFAPLAGELLARGWAPTIICECAGTQAEDARAMLDTWNALSREGGQRHLTGSLS